MIEASGHITIRRRAKDGNNGNAGVSGQILRWTEFNSGTQYHNDDESVPSPRYLDIVYVYNGSDTSRPWKVYECQVKTNANTIYTAKANDLSIASKWKELNNMQPIYTPLLIAQNALLRLLQTNKILVMKDDGITVNLGLGGGQYPLWVGAVNPTDANSYFDADGKIHAKDGEFSGKVTANSGLIGGFYIFKDAQSDIHLRSIYGTVNGSASADYTNPDFVPAIDLNGSKGTITLGSNFSATSDGSVTASQMSIENLDAHRRVNVNGIGVTYRISFDSYGINMIGDIKHDNKILYYIPGLDSYALRYCRHRVGDLWCRGQLGSMGRNCVEITGASAFFHTIGQSSTRSGVSETLAYATLNGTTARIIPLVGSTGDANDYPVDVVILQGDNSGYNYVLSDSINIGKIVIVANSNDDKSTYLYVNGIRKQITGGQAMVLVYVGTSMLSPSATSSYLGKGWLIASSYDNDFAWN